ncbi:MAG: hypothetical protein NTW19_12045 [Planctomycetota bacterium]|nr:hypothetical protein [Planctomycetota bacterium]
MGLDTLQRLDADADPTVAFAAGISLRDRKHPSPAFAAHATAMLASPEPWRTRAAVALASNPALEDRAVIAKLAADAAPSVRAALRKAQATSAVPRPLAELATDPDGEVIANAIRRIPPASIAPGGEPYLALVRFANDPDDVVVKAARNALAPHRPKEPVARARYDLAIEAPYLRHKAVALLAASKDPAARTALLGAVANDDPHTRIAALQAIAALDPAMARERLFAALADAHKLVRFHAAVLLAPIADASQAGGLRGVLAVQKDHATALYIADALARAESKPAPLPGQPANLVTGPDTIPWVWGPVGGRADSPYRANFMPSHGNHVRDDAITDIHKQGHALGRAYFYNIAAPSEPGLSLIDSSAQDNCWLYMDDQLNTDRLPFIDGIDFANSSLSPESLWPEGWRFFCEEAGIDSARVAGDKKKLNPYETRAWEVWSLRLCVEGRNRVYDYAKLKFGKLHPGFQVCESLGGFNGPGEIISQWKFDIGFCGYPGYAPESRRAMFNLIRRAKTLWPDRPVFWLGDGLEVKDLAIVKYDFKTPSTPMTGRSYRSYTDALSAWMAGADPGWANLWCLRAVNWGEPSYSGASISPEDTFGEAPKVREAIEMAFENVEPVIRQKEALAKASSKSPSLVPGDKEAQMDGLIESMVKSDGPDPMAQRIAKEKEQMLIGFKIYGKHLLDLARLFASLPRNNLRSDALVVLPEPAYQSERPNPAEPESGSPITELLNTYDVALNVNDASYLDLNRYRFIAVKDPEALSDAAIAAVTRWLKETPGVLYVHLDLTADNTRQASTPESLDGRLKNDWPWEGDVAVLPAPKAAPEPAASEEVGESTDADAAKAKAAKKLTTAAGAAIDAPDAALARTFKPAGPAARVLCSMGGSPALVAWQRPEFKGAVFFDGVEGGGAGYRNAVRDALAELKAKANVGVALPGPAKHETLAADAWSADVTLGAGDRVVAKGVDLLTGELDPVVGPDRGAAMVFRDFKGKYAAAYNGVAVLCDRPIRKVDKVEGGLRIECDGLIQAASESGKVVVAPAEGAALPAVPAEKYVRWLLLESSEGVATQTAGDGANAKQNVVSYIRCGRALTLKAK